MQKQIAYVLLVLALIPVGYIVYTSFNQGNKPEPVATQLPVQQQSVATIDYQQPQVVKRMEPNTSFAVKSVRVRDGYMFRVLLENGVWIDAVLARATKAEATPIVVNTLKSSKDPTVMLLRKVEDVWIVEMHLIIDKHPINLTALLGTQDMLL